MLLIIQAMINYLFEQGGLKDKFELFDEYFEVYSSNGKPDESIINFLIESAIIYYKREHPFESIKKHASKVTPTVTKIPKLGKNVAFRAKKAITDPKILLQVPESISTAIHAIKGNNTTALNIPLNSIDTGLPMNVDTVEGLNNPDNTDGNSNNIDYEQIERNLINRLKELTEGVGIDD